MANTKTSNQEFFNNPDLKNSFCILVLGRTGTGKSSLCNLLLGEQKFRATQSPLSVTEECQIEQFMVDGKQFIIIDTPGFFDTNKDTTSAEAGIKRSVRMTSPGPHVCLIVLQFFRITEEEQRTIRRIGEIFGSNIFEHSIVVFTGLDQLYDLTPEAFIQSSHPEHTGETFLQTLIRYCGNRFFAINNRETDPVQKSHARIGLITQIMTVIKANGNRPFKAINASSDSAIGGPGRIMYIMGSFELSDTADDLHQDLNKHKHISVTKHDVHTW